MGEVSEIVIGLKEMYGTNNPFKLCELLDITILYTNLGKEVNGFCQKVNDIEFIHINSRLAYEEQKYICAHELGHLILHEDLSLCFFIDNKLQIKDKKENEADLFAAELLIEESEICFDRTVRNISRYYALPEKAVSMKYKIS